MPRHRYWGPWFPEMWGFFIYVCQSVWSEVSPRRSITSQCEGFVLRSQCCGQWERKSQAQKSSLSYTELLRFSKAFSQRFQLFISNLAILNEVSSFLYLICSFSFCMVLGCEVLALWYYIAEPLCEECTALRGCRYLWGKPQMLSSCVVIFFHVWFCLSCIFITSHIRR